MPSDKPRFSLGSNLAGHRYRTSSRPRDRRFWEPSHPSIGEGSTGLGNLTDTKASPSGVLTVARKEGLDAKPVKPSQPRRERLRSKVGDGNVAEGCRVAAGPV